MGFRSKLTALINGPYRYRAGPNTLGIGVENMALVRPGIPHSEEFYRPRYLVRGEMSPMQFQVPTRVTVSVPATDLRGNGLYLSGHVALTGLIENPTGSVENG